jgi:hypothetical protein
MHLCMYGEIAYLSGSLGDKLDTQPRFASELRWLTGSVLIGLDARLLFWSGARVARVLSSLEERFFLYGRFLMMWDSE